MWGGSPAKIFPMSQFERIKKLLPPDLQLMRTPFSHQALYTCPFVNRLLKVHNMEAGWHLAFRLASREMGHCRALDTVPMSRVSTPRDAARAAKDCIIMVGQWLRLSLRREFQPISLFYVDLCTLDEGVGHHKCRFQGNVIILGNIKRYHQFKEILFILRTTVRTL